jgi:Zn finger protein HypA/HybF involved in hydrogenase expression
MKTKCPNCYEMNKDQNHKGYCGPCYKEIYINFGEDPNKIKELEEY